MTIERENCAYCKSPVASIDSNGIKFNCGTVETTEGDSKNQSDLCVERSRANIAESDCKTYKALWDSAASVASGDPVQCIHDLRSENSKLRSMLQAAEDGLQATKRLAISFHDTLLKNGLA